MDSTLLKELFHQEKNHWWHVAKRKLLREYFDRASKKVLVLGPGGGLLCKQLKEEGFIVKAIDISPIVKEHMQTAYGVEVIVHDLNLGLVPMEESFDVIIAADVLEHLANDEPVLRDIGQKLNPGGILLVTVPAFQSLWSYWDDQLCHFRRYRRKELIRRINDQAQLTIEKISYVYCLLFIPVWLYRKLNGRKNVNSSDFNVFEHPVIMKSVSLYCAVERFLLKFISLPWGVSLFVCARRSHLK